MTTTAEDVVGVSCFAGIGGLEYGFELLGIPTAVQIEWDEQASRVLAARFPDAVRFGDVREVTADAVRAVVGSRRVGCLYGGFPCQDVSVAGRRAGMAGERSSLYVELVRLADALDPEWLVVENVPGLLSADVDPDANDGAGLGRGTAFAVVLGDITGYRPPVPDGGWRNSGVCSGPRRTVAWRVLDARHFGVAQRRRRVFLVASARDRSAPAAVLLEPEGVRGNPPPGEPPRPRFATRSARPAVRAGDAGADGAGAAGAGTDDLTATAGQRLAATLGSLTGGQRQDLDGMTYVPLNGAGGEDVGHALLASESDKWDETRQTYVGALTASGGPSALDDQATTQLVVDDPARPVAVRGREGGSQAELGDEPLANALRAGDGGSSRQPAILAYDEGIKVTETDVAPPLLADGDPAERTDRGLRVVGTFRKAQRAHDGDDCERWEPDEVADTLDAGGQTARTATAVVGYSAMQDFATGDDESPPLTSAGLSRGTGQGVVEAAVPLDLKAATKTDHRTGVGTVGAGVGEDGDPAYTLTSTTPGAVGTAAVRRLTPLECERLQGAPDLWTKVPGSSDSSRYKELGNAVCFAVSMWLAWRIQAYRNGWRPA